MLSESMDFINWIHNLFSKSLQKSHSKLALSMLLIHSWTEVNCTVSVPTLLRMLNWCKRVFWQLTYLRTNSNGLKPSNTLHHILLDFSNYCTYFYQHYWCCLYVVLSQLNICGYLHLFLLSKRLVSFGLRSSNIWVIEGIL